MIYTHVAAALVAAALASWGTWTAQDWRYTGQIATIKATHLEALNTAVREARATESRRFVNVQEAQNAATKRATLARADADRARTELERLRDDNAAALRASRDSLAACNQYATTVGGLFDQCSGDLATLAGQARGHSDDVRLLLEAWPR